MSLSAIYIALSPVILNTTAGVNMIAFGTSVLLVSAVILLASGASSEDLLYLEDCTDACPLYPNAKCQVRCVFVAEGEGHDCLNTYFVDGEPVVCDW